MALNNITLSNTILLERSKCITCWKCAQICKNIWIWYLELKLENPRYISENCNKECIYCGQCTLWCPVWAIREQSQIEELESILQDKSKTIIAQTAPSVRVSIGEAFWSDQDMSGQLITAYKLLGFSKVFDVNLGADITSMCESEELIEKINKWEPLPMFSSCCPSWVKYLKHYHPQQISRLSCTRSPHIISGWAYKTWWAEKNQIDPANIVVVSIMPCTSKKYEAKLYKIWDLYAVDYVITARELVLLLKKHNIILPNLEKSEIDTYGTHSGASILYWTSGGVAEAVLRTVHFKLTWKELEGWRWINQIKIWNLELNIWVISQPKHAHEILSEIQDKPKSYDFIEFMACEWGCIGWWGQIIPTNSKIIEKRKALIYQIDKSKTFYWAHNNPVCLEFMEYLKTQPLNKQNEIVRTSSN